MIRTIQTEEITRNIKEMCIEANHFLAEDMEHAMKKAAEKEIAVRKGLGGYAQHKGVKTKFAHEDTRGLPP